MSAGWFYEKSQRVWDALFHSQVEWPVKKHPQAKLLVGIFLIPFLSSIFVHMFAINDKMYWKTLFHSVTLGSAYLISGLLLLQLYKFVQGRRTQRKNLSVFEFWIASLFVFVVGHLIASFTRPFFFDLHDHAPRHSPVTRVLLLSPLWIVPTLTYLLITSRDRKLKHQQKLVEQLQERLQALQQTRSTGKKIDHHDERFNCEYQGKQYSIPVVNIGYIWVQEHYCYVHYQKDECWKKLELRMSLSKAGQKLPKNKFIQTHRSYLVNLDFIDSVERTTAGAEIIIKGDENRVPISKHRIRGLFPRIEAVMQES